MDQDARRRIDNARDVLVGKIPDPKAQVEQITSALIYKFMDDMDRDAQGLGGKPSFFTNGYEKYAWSNILDPRIGGQERLNRYAEALSTMSQNPHLPQLFRTIFKDAFLPYRDPTTLNLFLKEIDGFTYDHSENLGDAYEYLLSILGSQGDAGQFRTPRHIIDFMVRVVDPKKNETMLDPASGTAGFLISSYRHIIEQNRDHRLTPDEKERLAGNLQGYDISPDMVRIALVNMYLHSFPNPHVYEYDTLSSEEHWDEQFDICMANPPFMTPKGGILPHKRFQIQANRSEVLFVDYIAEHLKSTGRAAVIVPEGIIFQSANAYKALRKMLVKTWGLWAVVSLPAGVFQPYSGVKTSILFLDKVFSKKTDEILFVKVQNDGFDLGAQRRPINKNDLPEGQTVLQQWLHGNKQENPMASWVGKGIIAETGDYNLTSDRYREVVATNTKWPMVKLGDMCDIYQPETITAKEILPRGPYRVYGANGPIGYFVKYNHESSEVLVTCRGATCGTVNKSEPKSWITGNAMVVSPKDERLDRQYLFYVLSYRDLSATITGTAQPQITRASLAPLKVPLPPLDVQREIVAELDTYQRIIDGAKQVIANWHPTFDIDPSWPMVQLGDERFFQIEAGGTPDSTNPDYWNGDIKWATLVDLPPENFITEITDTVRKITALGLRESSAKLLPTSTVLVSSRATIGRVGIALTPLATNQGFKNVVIRDPNKADERYVALALTRLVDRMTALASGGTFKEISKTNFMTLEVPLPSIEVQRALVAEIMIEQNAVQQNKRLANLYAGKTKRAIENLWKH
jgi:type I restriction enzyme M protein